MAIIINLIPAVPLPNKLALIALFSDNSWKTALSTVQLDWILQSEETPSDILYKILKSDDRIDGYHFATGIKNRNLSIDHLEMIKSYHLLKKNIGKFHLSCVASINNEIATRIKEKL